MRVTSSAGIAELGKGCNEVDMDTTEGAQMNVCCLNKQSVSARVIRVYSARITYARFPPLKLGACFVSAICHVDCPIIWRHHIPRGLKRIWTGTTCKTCMLLNYNMTVR